MASRHTASNLESGERIRKQLELWRERLVDLTRGNPLLGINRSRTSKLQVTSPSAAELFRRVVLNDEKLRMPLVSRRPAAPQQPQLHLAGEDLSAWQVRPGDVTFDGDPDSIFRRLRRIRDNARTTVEERGVTTLHLTLGAVRWTDPYLGESVAPIILIPCTFERGGPDEPLMLTATDEEEQLNPALDLYLRKQHKKELPTLDDEPTEAAIRVLFRDIRSMLGPPDWQVTDEVWLSTFSYETLTIYQDLDPHTKTSIRIPRPRSAYQDLDPQKSALAESAPKSDIVRALARIRVPTDRSERLPNDLDSLPTPDALPVPVDSADASQLEALALVRTGRHVLIYGPPGTGKSQTIANLIADALGQGKTVLFVSAKIAALEVVYDRLSKLGFGRFCLEAHSTKAGKRRVIDELRRALEAAEELSGQDYHATLRRFVDLREKLNEAVRELHQKRAPSGSSIYTGIGRYEQLRHLPEMTAALPWPDPTAVDSSRLEAALDLLGELQAQSSVFAELDSHPWRGCRLTDSSRATFERLLAALEAVRAACRAMLDAAAPLEPFLGAVPECSIEALERGSAAVERLSKATWLPDGWSTTCSEELERRASVLETAAGKADALREACTQFAERTRGIGPLQAQPLLAEALGRFRPWYRRLWFDYRGWERTVEQAICPKKADYEALAELARLAHTVAEITAWFEEHKSSMQVVRPSAPGEVPSSESSRDAASATKTAAALRHWHEKQGTHLRTPETRIVGPEARAAAQEILDQLPLAGAAVRESFAQIDEAWGSQFVGKLPVRSVPIKAVGPRCSETVDAKDRFAEWVRLQDTLDRCRAAGLKPFVEALKPHGSTQAVDLFHRRFWLLWSDQHISRSPALASFHGRHRESLREEFRGLDEKLRQQATRAAIDGAARRAAQINDTGEVARESELGKLRVELRRQRPRPLRRLFAEIPKVLQAIKPCMMMSPLSVSTYLTPGRITFDLVVFDKASQLPTQETIPAILRAEQVIVAGDEKQLPPTSFFSSALYGEADEEERDEDAETAPPLESLLDDCATLDPLVAPAKLRWHYRSRDERLIAFSNHTFYEGGLITFPSPGKPADRGVQLRYVENGAWDRGRSRTNRAEARVVAQIILQQLEQHPDRSIGVVALNVAQKEAIEDALEEEFADRPDLRARLSVDGQEPFFVKSLENVQGDERDTIIISIGYGPDANRNVYLNFGPVSQQGGWRRLNVLVTRAKHLTILVTSLRGSDLGAVSAENRGAAALRDYITYAERGCELPQDGAVVTNAETNDFEDAVAAALRARGVQVDEQVGASSFRIDLAVRDPRDPGRYVLGIECDGATYHRSRTARDRDLLRADILRGHGWRLHRIWSTDWFRNPSDTIDAAMRAVERATAQGAPDAGVPAPASRVPRGASPKDSSGTLFQMRVSAPRSPLPRRGAAPIRPQREASPSSVGLTYLPGVPYQPTPRERSDPSIFRDARARLRLVSEIVRVVRCESPIHRELVLERLRVLHNLERVGKIMRDTFERALYVAQVQYDDISRDARGFLWARGVALARFRVPAGNDEARKVAHIPQEEIRLAVLHVAETQFGLPRDALIRETAQCFGFERTGALIADAIGDVVDALIEKGELRQSGPQLALP